MNGQENEPEPELKETIEKSAILLMEAHRQSETMKALVLEFPHTRFPDSLRQSRCENRVNTYISTLTEVQQQIGEMKEVYDDILKKWEPPSCSSSEKDNSISNPKQLTEKILESSDTPPNSNTATSTTESEIKELKILEAIPDGNAKAKKLIKKGSKEPPLDSDDDCFEATFKKARLVNQVERKLDKLSEELDLAKGVRAAERDRFFESLNMKKSEETKGDPLALEEPPTGSKK